MATRLDAVRPVDVEMYDDSASNLGSEVSYHSSTNPQKLHMIKQWPSGPVSAAQFRPFSGQYDDPDDTRSRPGRPPARPDNELTSEELRRRNRRRQRNREAAQRCRQRRLDQIDVLKDEVTRLKEEGAEVKRENAKLQAELRKANFTIELYERTVGPLSQLTAQPYRQPMLVQPTIKVEQPSNQAPMQPLQLSNVPHEHQLQHQALQQQVQAAQHVTAQQAMPPQIQPIMLPISAPAPPISAAAPPSTSATAPIPQPETTTPSSVSTSSPPVPAIKPLVSPYSGLVPLISPQTHGIFLYTPTQPGLITPFTPTLPEGIFTFPTISKEIVDKARKDSVTQFDRVAQQVALPTPTAVAPVEDVSDGNASVSGSQQEDKSSEKK